MRKIALQHRISDRPVLARVDAKRSAFAPGDSPHRWSSPTPTIRSQAAKIASWRAGSRSGPGTGVGARFFQ